MPTDSTLTRWRPLALLALALLILDVALTVDNAWPTPGVVWTGRLSVELAMGILALAALIARRGEIGRRALTGLSILWMLLTLGHYADVTAPALYGRDVNLYWDFKLLPDVAAMVTRVAPAWLIAAVVLVVAVVLLLAFRLFRWSFAQLITALADGRARRVLAAASIATIAVFVLAQRDAESIFAATVSKPVAATYAHQAALALRGMRGPAALPPSPTIESSLDAVNGADIMLVFIESYGAVADESSMAHDLAASRSVFDTAARETGRSIVSAYVESPTFGGSSWLAHVSLLTGVEVRDPDTNALLMAQSRDTLVKMMARHGRRTVALMPGLRLAWPEGSFYGFDQVYGADRLAYAGPEFGWFAIPDQFSLARFDALEPPSHDRPRFVFFPTISTHFPFSPTPPYQPDWPRMLTAKPYDGPPLVRAYAKQPDWTHFAPGYVDSMQYDFDVLAGYLREHADRNLVMILLGDHQPPALVSGAGASWNVPVHIVVNTPQLTRRLVDRGFRPGMTPTTPTLSKMHALLPILLDAFGDR